MSLTVDWNDILLSFKPEPEEEPQCRSVLYPATTELELGARRCDVNHWETRQVLHGADVAGNPTWWTDEAAARSKADYLKPVGPLCLECPREAKARGLCSSCAHRELAADNPRYEIRTENAAWQSL